MPQLKAEYGEERIFYIDESGINSNEIAEYGWSKKGQPCHALKSGGHGVRLSLISAVRSSSPFKFVMPLVFQGSCNRRIFTGWLEYLLGSLAQNECESKKKYLLILDNASIHKGKEIEEVAARYNTRVLYLPAYSPDLNPIEKAWSVLKRKVRQIVAQQDKSVDEALDIAFKEMY